MLTLGVALAVQSRSSHLIIVDSLGKRPMSMTSAAPFRMFLPRSTGRGAVTQKGEMVCRIVPQNKNTEMSQQQMITGSLLVALHSSPDEPAEDWA